MTLYSAFRVGPIYLMADLVFNIRPAAASDIRNLSSHEAHRTPDGFSRIDLSRSDRNRVLLGPATQQDALDHLFDKEHGLGVERPTAQAEAPYIQIVLGVGPEFFRPSTPQQAGVYEQERVDVFEREVMVWLGDTFGGDLIHASIHLDEVTPHLHALVAPTYERKARTPGRQKKDETAEQFEARKKAAAERLPVRTVGRASHALLAQRDSFRQLRRSLADHLAHLGIEYGDDRAPDSPAPRTTMEWVKEEAHIAGIQLEGSQAELAEMLAKIESGQEELDKLLDEKVMLEDWSKILSEREAAAEQQEGHLAQATKNLQVAMARAEHGTHDREITPKEMANQPKEFDVLKAAAPEGRPTWGFRARFWALNFSITGRPKPFSEPIRKALEAAFDRIALWARKIETTLAKAEREAARMLAEVQQRTKDQVFTEAHIVSATAYIELLRNAIKAAVGPTDSAKVMQDVEQQWAEHPENPNRPIRRDTGWDGPSRQ